MSIEVKNLFHDYSPDGKHPSLALKDVSVTIGEGEFVGIIGHTGSGKSTFVQHLNALLQPTSGSVTVDGINLADRSKRAMARKRVGMVFQYPEYQLFEETVAKDVAFGPKNMGEPPAKFDRIVREAMAQVELPYDDFAQKSPFELSGGEKRRVAIAGILATKPSILILDEPMAGLDPVRREEIKKLIVKLHESGMTIVMVSHSMEDIAQLASKILVFSKGELVMQGAREEIFARVDELMGMNLDIPQPCKLAAMLRDRGFDIPVDTYTIEGLCDGIAQCVKKDGR